MRETERGSILLEKDRRVENWRTYSVNKIKSYILIYYYNRKRKRGKRGKRMPIKTLIGNINIIMFTFNS